MQWNANISLDLLCSLSKARQRNGQISTRGKKISCSWRSNYFAKYSTETFFVINWFLFLFISENRNSLKRSTYPLLPITNIKIKSRIVVSPCKSKRDKCLVTFFGRFIQELLEEAYATWVLWISLFRPSGYYCF